MKFTHIDGSLDRALAIHYPGTKTVTEALARARGKEEKTIPQDQTPSESTLWQESLDETVAEVIAWKMAKEACCLAVYQEWSKLSDEEKILMSSDDIARLSSQPIRADGGLRAWYEEWISCFKGLKREAN